MLFKKNIYNIFIFLITPAQLTPNGICLLFLKLSSFNVQRATIKNNDG